MKKKLKRISIIVGISIPILLITHLYLDSILNCSGFNIDPQCELSLPIIDIVEILGLLLKISMIIALILIIYLIILIIKNKKDKKTYIKTILIITLPTLISFLLLTLYYKYKI